MGDVEVVAHGQTPHLSSDAGGDALPPQVSDATRCAPMGQLEEGQGHPGGQGGNHSTPCCSHRAPIGQDVLIPGLDGGADALFELTAILELLLPLLSLLQLCNHPFRRETGRTDGRFPTKVRSLPLFLACATISSYCCLCFCASSAGFAGRLLQQRIKTTAYFDFLLHGTDQWDQDSERLFKRNASVQ